MNQGLIPAKWAALTPRNEAIIDVPNSRRLTYGEFDALVRRLANGLRGLGLEKGDRFGVLSRNGAEYMALYFAAGRAGLVAATAELAARPARSSRPSSATPHPR